jgi:TonB-dependent receptor
MRQKAAIQIIYNVLVFFIILPIAAFAQNENIAGKVKDAATGENLPGANIVLQGTNYGTSSDRYGQYRIENVPLGTYHLVVSYIGYERYTVEITLARTNYTLNQDVQLAPTAYKLEEVVVSGAMQGQVKAINQQKNSEIITNVLSREEMEKFPDINTAEVLERIPGIYISRNEGEGQFVYIRGTDPRLTEVTIDGQKFASADRTDRVTDLGIVNATQLASIEVNKVLTPDMDASGVGGQVNIVTKSPFDYERSMFTIDAGRGYATQGKNPLYRVDASYVGFLGSDKVGYSVNGNFYQNNINGQRVTMGYGNIMAISRQTIQFATNNIELDNLISHRNRYGFSGAIEYRPDILNSYFIRGMYNLEKQDQTDSQMRYRLADGRYYALNPTTIAPGVITVDSFLVVQSRMDYTMVNDQPNSTLISAAVGGKNIWDVMHLDYYLHYSFGNQVRQDPPRIRSEWAVLNRPNFRIDLTNGDYPSIQIINGALISDPANYQTDSQELKAYTTSNTNYAGAVNGKLFYNLFSIPSELKSGFLFNIEKKDQDGWTLRYEWSGNGNPTMDQVASGETITGFLNNHYVFAPIIDVGRANALILANDNPAPGQPGLTHLGSESEFASADAIGGNYANTEGFASFYLMNTFKLGDLLAIAGLRDEHTSTKYEGIQIITDLQGHLSYTVPNVVKTNYNNVFFDLLLRYALTKMTNIRAAFTQTIARPNYYDLVPYNYLSTDAHELLQGNPNLGPTLSTNLDLMFEYYFQGIGVASLGVFYKDIANIIYERHWLQIGGPYDGFTRVQPVNFGRSKLYGFEINWQRQFSFLPGFLNGFGIYANYTYTKSKADLQFREWSVIPGQAGDVGNLGLGYEKYGLTARLSAYYHSKVLTGIGDTPDYDTYSDKNLRLDFTSIYDIFDNLSIYMNIRNLTNERDRFYMGIPSRPSELELYGISIDGGIKIKL